MILDSSSLTKSCRREKRFPSPNCLSNLVDSSVMENGENVRLNTANVKERIY